MRAGEASATARRVAAQRLTFERVPAPFGDAEADARLARDVAGSAEGAPGPLTAYLAARTAFFDRVVVNAIEGGATQVVVAGAGYDGRALRYCRPGVRWFELDHPDTQRDKRSRLERLGIPTGHVGFAPADFTIDDVASALDGAGHDRTVPSTILCEGVAVYLERDVLARLLRGLRNAAASGSRLAISLSVATSRPEQDGRRAAFASAVDAMGEPARDVLTADGATDLLVEAGWIPDVGEAHRRARRVGFVVAAAGHMTPGP